MASGCGCGCGGCGRGLVVVVAARWVEIHGLKAPQTGAKSSKMQQGSNPPRQMQNCQRKIAGPKSTTILASQNASETSFLMASTITWTNHLSCGLCWTLEIVCLFVPRFYANFAKNKQK